MSTRRGQRFKVKKKTEKTDRGQAEEMAVVNVNSNQSNVEKISWKR